MGERENNQALGRVFDALKRTKLDEVAGVLLRDTVIGKAGRVIKGISEIFGGSEDPDVLAKAIEDATPAQRVALLELAAREREAELETIRNEQDNVTARHASDMLSDSRLSKSLRPSVCIALNTAAVLYSFLILVLVAIEFGLRISGRAVAELDDTFLFDLARTALVSLWSAAGAYNIFYVGGRTWEKRESFQAAAKAIVGRGGSIFK